VWWWRQVLLPPLSSLVLLSKQYRKYTAHVLPPLPGLLTPLEEADERSPSTLFILLAHDEGERAPERCGGRGRGGRCSVGGRRQGRMRDVGEGLAARGVGGHDVFSPWCVDDGEQRACGC
jgi:hypothetical protein